MTPSPSPAIPPAIDKALDALIEAARDEGHVYGDPAGFKGNCEAAGKRTAAARAALVAAIADALDREYRSGLAVGSVGPIKDPPR
jgi:hypothetical protein